MARNDKTPPRPKYPSSTGKKDPPVDMTNWRKKLMRSRIKFDDEQKKIYLDNLSDHGLKGRAAESAGVSLLIVHKHLENDPDFKESYNQAIETYRDKFVDHALNLAYNGIPVTKWDKAGNVIEKRVDFPIRLIEMELKRVEPAYREKQSLDLTGLPPGVLVAPAGQTPEEAIAEGEKANAEAAAKKVAEK